MKLSFARGWFSAEDSTGEFAAYANKNRNSRVVFLGRRIYDEAWVQGAGRPAAPNSDESSQLAPREPQ